MIKFIQLLLQVTGGSCNALAVSTPAKASSTGLFLQIRDSTVRMTMRAFLGITDRNLIEILTHVIQVSYLVVRKLAGGSRR